MTALERVAEHFRWNYHVEMADVVITDTPGYWEQRTPCGGRGQCRAPIHAFLFNEGPIHHTFTYFDSGRDPATGRYASVTRTWRELKATAPAPPQVTP